MGKKTKKGRSVKNNSRRTEGEPEALTRAPHSFVIHRGVVGGYILELTKDFRKVMEPFTASSLQSRKKNTIKDFVSVSGLLHVSHLCIFTHTEISTYLKIARFPRGPTLTFRVHNYCLSRDVRSNLKKQCVFNQQFQHAPLIVLNSFSGEGMHLKLMASMFQNMFPTINITKVSLNSIRRCVLLNYNPSSKSIDFRHYAIRVVPVGISKGVKRIVQSKVPNLSNMDDISEFLTKSGQLSDSEVDDPASHITLPEKMTRGNLATNKSSIRLVELGPRLSLQLMKVENGMLNGEILFHDYIHKTEEELLSNKKHREEKVKLRAKRTQLQEENKRNKESIKEEQKQNSLKGMNKKTESDVLMSHDEEKTCELGENQEEDDINDAEWYRQEVGEEPGKDLFDPTSHLRVGKRKSLYGGRLRKMKKMEKAAGTAREKQKFSKRDDHFDKKKKLHSGKKILGSKIKKKTKH